MLREEKKNMLSAYKPSAKYAFLMLLSAFLNDQDFCFLLSVLFLRYNNFM